MNNKPTIPIRRTVSPWYANELHPAWCDGLTRDSAPGCGMHATPGTHVVLTSNGYELTDQGATFPMLHVVGSVSTDGATIGDLAVEVTTWSPDRHDTAASALMFTVDEARQLADMLEHRRPGSVAATGEAPVSAVRVFVLDSGSLSLVGGMSAVLDTGEAGQLCQALRECAALPVDPSTFGTWQQLHRGGVAA